MALDRRCVEPLLQFLADLWEKNSLAIASSESFGGWANAFETPALRAIADCLIFNGTIIRAGSVSCATPYSKAGLNRSPYLQQVPPFVHCRPETPSLGILDSIGAGSAGQRGLNAARRSWLRCAGRNTASQQPLSLPNRATQCQTFLRSWRA